MKNIFFICIVGFFIACTGDKGGVGPVGDTGTKGATGAVGQNSTTQGAVGDKGPIGPTGDTGAIGATGSIGNTGAVGTTGAIGATGATGNTGTIGVVGATGDKGVVGATGATGSTPSVSAIFTDWADITDWKLGGVETNYYTAISKKDYILSMLPNAQKLSIDYFKSRQHFLVSNDDTKEPVGSFYVFYSFTHADKEESIFNNEVRLESLIIQDFSNGFFDVENLKVYPSLNQFIGIRFNKTNYQATDDFVSIAKGMKPKTRFVYIPIGLPSKTGRKAADIKTYEELVKAYGIPMHGASN